MRFNYRRPVTFCLLDMFISWSEVNHQVLNYVIRRGVSISNYTWPNKFLTHTTYTRIGSEHTTAYSGTLCIAFGTQLVYIHISKNRFFLLLFGTIYWVLFACIGNLANVNWEGLINTVRGQKLTTKLKTHIYGSYK